LDGDAVLRRSLCDYPLPLHAAGTRDARSVLLDGHLQSEEDRRFILVENGDYASAVDDGTSPQKMFLDVRTIRRALSSESSSAERK
jgi:hypothetical protein